ncbi:Rid family hydrolase [Methylobacterium soli]|uniref:RidA family protein n=1 Tax=Methylobacterium soli TaxID=553447 RepID=A0A6L3T2I4_9HYPH|nr:Rid family hydrolase [Methylobacterium soli]KAB1080286.1 hypothetical protein F6X53_06175 [Methylobacterium soli]GJE44740.1 hypothetical protein AEGHOMDF_3931 [Methylobacterium soli]
MTRTPQFFNLLADKEQSYCMSIAVRAGDFVFIGGLTAIDNLGNEIHADDAALQMKRIYEILGQILHKFGGTPQSIVSETIYYSVDDDTFNETLFPHRQAFFGDVGPSVAGMRVVSFTSPAIRVETTAIAYIPEA